MMNDELDPGNHRRSKLLFWLLLVTAKRMHFLIGSTYPDGTLSSTRHTEMPFDHLTVNFMLFFLQRLRRFTAKFIVLLRIVILLW